MTVIWKDKANFARDIVKIIEDDKIKFEDLDDLAKKMIKNIYTFIKNKNS